MAKIDVRKIYEDRIKEIDNQIRDMARKKNWTGYGKLKVEKERLKAKLGE